MYFIDFLPSTDKLKKSLGDFEILIDKTACGTAVDVLSITDSSCHSA